MFELIYLVSIFLFFGVAKLITTYGFTTKETGGGYYDRKKEKVPLTLVGFVYAAINGYGPTGADIGAWFKARFKKKGE